MWSKIKRFFLRWQWMVQYEKSLNDRAEVEQVLLDAWKKKRPLPDTLECRKLAMKLGVPKEWRD